MRESAEDLYVSDTPTGSSQQCFAHMESSEKTKKQDLDNILLTASRRMYRYCMVAWNLKLLFVNSCPQV